jgi:UDPglucose 6-dehydrogenase
VGSHHVESAKSVAGLYCQNNVPIIYTSPASAELIKYAANSFLAVKLSFVNEIASICEKTGAEILPVVKGLGLDSRIGERFLQPGPGWGGSCFPKDTLALISTAQSNGVPSKIVEAAVSSNIETIKRISQRLITKFEGSLQGKTIGIWGIAFKAETDDTRESPALEIISHLIYAGAKIKVYDPVATLPEKFSQAKQVSTAKDALKNVDALMVLTEWPEFGRYKADDFILEMKTPVVFDTRRILNSSWNSVSDLILVGK